MKRNHDYLILWGKSDGIAFSVGNRRWGIVFFALLRSSGLPPENNSAWCFPPAKHASSEMRGAFQCCPQAGCFLAGVAALCKVQEKKSTGKRKKEPQTSVHQRLRFYIIKLSHLSSFFFIYLFILWNKILIEFSPKFWYFIPIFGFYFRRSCW